MKKKKMMISALLIGIIACAVFSVRAEKLKNDPEKMDISMTVTPVCSTISAEKEKIDYVCVDVEYLAFYGRKW